MGEGVLRAKVFGVLIPIYFHFFGYSIQHGLLRCKFILRVKCDVVGIFHERRGFAARCDANSPFESFDVIYGPFLNSDTICCDGLWRVLYFFFNTTHAFFNAAVEFNSC